MSDIKITVVSRSKEKEVIKIPVIEIKEDENRVESAQKLIVRVQESELPKPLQLVVKIKEKRILETHITTNMPKTKRKCSTLSLKSEFQ